MEVNYAIPWDQMDGATYYMTDPDGVGFQNIHEAKAYYEQKHQQQMQGGSSATLGTPAGGIAGGYGSQNYGALGPAVPPVTAPPQPGGGESPAPAATGSGSSSYTSGGGGGGSYQSTPAPVSAPPASGGGGQSEWSQALHQSGALSNPRANPIPFGSHPAAASGAFDPYLANTQGQGGGAPQAGGGVPPVSMPPDPTAGASQAPMTNFDPGAQPRTGGAQQSPMGNTAGAPAPVPVAAPVQPQVSGATMTPEEIRLRYGMMNKGLSQNYGAY